MNTASISILNLDTGETLDTDLKLKDSKFLQRGHKMYNNGLIHMIDVLTKDEMKKIVTMFDGNTIDYYNVLKLPFHKLTPDMSKAARSRFKKKLVEGGIISIFDDKIMLNPFIFVPRGDKNIRNCNHLTQRAWVYLIEDANAWSEEVENHIELILGLTSKRTHIMVGDKDDSKYIELPQS